MKGIYELGATRFQVKWKPPGKDTKRITASFKTRTEAEGFLLRAQSDFKLGKPIGDAREGVTKAGVMTIQELFNRVDKKRWSGNPNCKRPLEGSASTATRYVNWCGPKMPVDEALAEDRVAEFVRQREDVLLNSGGTINRNLSAICTLSKEAVRLGLLVRVPDLTWRTEGQCRIRWFTTDEEKLLFYVVRQWGYSDYAELFTFLVDTGCRPGEAYQLKWTDFSGTRVDLDGSITKNSTPRVLMLTPRAAEAVARMKELHGALQGPFAWAHPNRSLTRSLWRRLRGHFAWMGDDAVIYTFRHTCASRLVQRGIDLYRVQIWMGHKSMEMTQRYAKFAPKQMDELASVLAG